MTGMQERIDDYLAMGVACVWVVDPKLRRGYAYSAEGMRPAKDNVLRVPGTQVEARLDELFAQL
jgi:hypothetical protein